MNKDEALKLAQRALSNRTASTKSIYEAITAIKEALARPEQEPLEYWNAVKFSTYPAKLKEKNT